MIIAMLHPPGFFDYSAISIFRCIILTSKKNWASLESSSSTLFNTGMPRPTAQQVLAHPVYPEAVWMLKPTLEGWLPVAAGRGGPIMISWEVHGSGNIKLVWVMGLGAIKSAWQRQVLKFGHEDGDRYSCLVCDNRGSGKSDKPIMRYSTSEMAKDAIELIDHLGWTSERQLHIIGVSMGGMIAQEMAMLIPARICSLTLASSAARIENTVGFFENLLTRTKMFIPKSLDRSVSDAAISLFPDSWLEAPDGTRLPQPGTALADFPQPQGHYSLFDTNYERFAAQELNKRLDPGAMPRHGFMLQAIAAGWHYKSPQQLREIGDRVGRDRILVVHGTADRMITVHHGHVLIEELKPGKSFVLNGSGHVLMLEKTEWFDAAVEELFQRAERMGRK